MKTKLAAFMVVASISSAHAAGPGEKPDDKIFKSPKVVGVLPVLASGLSRAAIVQGVTVASATPTGNKAILDPNKVAKVDASQGFGFAGQATSNDVKLLTYGFLLSTLALEESANMPAQAERLAQARELLAPLSADTVKAIDLLIAAGKTGTFNVEALAAAFDAAQKGIVTGPARGHGYLVAGLWSGLTVLALTNKAVSPELAAMAPPLATMFEEDAQFEGADRKVAASLRELSGLLTNSAVTADIYIQALSKMFAVKEDSP